MMQLQSINFKCYWPSLMLLLLISQLGSVNNTIERGANELEQASPGSGEDATTTIRSYKRPALTGTRWFELEELRCKSIEGGDANLAESKPQLLSLNLWNIWARLLSKCSGDQLVWRYRYADELKPSFNHQVRDPTIDERLANIIYTISLNNMFDPNYFTFNSGDALEDSKNEVRVAGTEVDDTKCAQELEIMSNLIEEMQNKLEQFRTANETTRANLSLEERHIRLARVLDSFGRYESGLLDGKFLLAGSYAECIGSQLSTENELEDSTIPMRYCWANMNINRHLHPLLRNRKRFDHETTISVLSVATCLPKSCHSKSFHQDKTRAVVQRLVNSQMRLPGSIYVDSSLQLETVFCLVDDDSQYGRIPTSGKLCLLFVGCWVILCLGATFTNKPKRLAGYEEGATKKLQTKRSRPSFQSIVCNCLDLGQSWHDFTSDKRQLDPAAAIDLDVLNPIKVIACAFCVVSHTALVFGSASTSIGQIAAHFDTGPLMMSAILTSTVVETFFVISGMLVTHISLQKLATSKTKTRPPKMTKQDGESSKQTEKILTTSTSPEVSQLGLLGSAWKATREFSSLWLVLALHRYLRIVPLYALLFWFRRDVLNHLGSGPLWDHGLNHSTASGACTQEPWYMPFTFLSAFKQVSKQCFVPSWSISNDIFFALFSPPLILLFSSRPTMALISTILLTLASLLAALDALAGSFAPSVWQLLELRLQGIILLSTSLSHLYTWPFYRASSILIGTLAGYYLFKFEQKHTNTKTKPADQQTTHAWPNWLSGPATKLSFAYLILHAILTVVTNDLKPYIAPYHRVLSCYLVNVDRVIWSMANAVLFLQMMTTWRHKPLMQQFASQLWRTLAKLNFAVLFIHWIMIVIYMGSLPAPPTFTLWQVFSAFTVIFILALVISSVIHLVFENPIDKLVKRLVFAS